MADTKTTALAALTAPAANDLAMVVDVSDTTMDAAGTNKKITLADLWAGGDIPMARAKSASVTFPVIPGVVVNAMSDIALTTNVARYNPIIIREACTLTEMWVAVSTLASSSHVTLALYNASVDWQPGTLVSGASGEIDSSSTGLKKITGLSISLSRGNYLTRVHSDSNPTLRTARGHPAVGAIIGTSTGTSQQLSGLTETITYTSTPESPGTAWTGVASGSAAHDYFMLLLLTT